MADQIDSSSKTEQIPQQQIVAPQHNWSSMNLLSVEVADLVKLMDSAEGPLQVED